MPEFDKSSEALQSKMDQLLSMVDLLVDDAAGHLRTKIGLIESRGDRLVWMTALLGALGTFLAAVATYFRDRKPINPQLGENFLYGIQLGWLNNRFQLRHH